MTIGILSRASAKVRDAHISRVSVDDVEDCVVVVRHRGRRRLAGVAGARNEAVGRAEFVADPVAFFLIGADALSAARQHRLELEQVLPLGRKCGATADADIDVLSVEVMGATGLTDPSRSLG